jgi:hypothetical protein
VISSSIKRKPEKSDTRRRKKMKKTRQLSGLAVLLFAAGFLLVYAQQTPPERAVVPFSNPSKPGLVDIEIMRGSITVKGYAGKEVIVEARLREKMIAGEEQEEEKAHAARAARAAARAYREEEGAQEKAEKEKAAGMNLIQIETAGLTVEEANNVVSVETESWKRAVDLTVQVPAATSLKLSNQTGGSIVVENVAGEIEVENMSGGITLTGISGTVVADTMNGEIKAQFLRVNPDKPMSFSTMNGDIDLTLPADIKATLKMKSDRGNIYSDFNVNLVESAQKKEEDERKEGGKYKITFERTITGTINGGGVELQFNTFNGNIYVRKTK